MRVIGRPGCWATALHGASPVSVSAAIPLPTPRRVMLRTLMTIRSTHRRFGGKLRPAHAHAAAGILPKLLGRMQVTDGAGDRVEVVGREALGDIGVIERLLLDRRQDVLGERRHLGIGAGAAGLVLF